MLTSVQNATPAAKSTPSKADAMMMAAAPNTASACPTPGTTVIPAACPPPSGYPTGPACGKADKMDTTGGTGSAAVASKGGAKRSRVSKTTTAPAEAPTDCPGFAEPCEGKGPESGTWLIVAKAVRMHLKNHEVSMHCGSDALPALNAKLADLIKDAIGRAQTNGRKTLKACDF